MATLLQVTGLTHSEGQKLLFEDLELLLKTGDRVALVGHNGTGKTTLLSILAGFREPDAGKIQRKRRLHLSLVEQFLPPQLSDASLKDAVAERLAPEDAWKADALLFKLGFPESAQHRKLGDLSGGEKNRVMFARAVVVEPDLLLLDEPTNYLDLTTLLLFQNTLSNFRGGLLVVSHDRAFLDEVCTTTLVLRDKQIYRFQATFSEAMVLLAQADEAAQNRRAAEEKKIDAVKRGAARLAEWGRIYDNEDLARRAKNMQKRAQRMDSEKTFVSEGSALDLEMEFTSVRSRQVLRIENLKLKVPGGNRRNLFELTHLLIRPGDRIGLLGVNGAGKTTFIRTLLSAFSDVQGRGESLPESSFHFSPQISLGYFDQELKQVSGQQSILNFVLERVEVSQQSVHQRLIHAGFPYSDHGRKLNGMSGGERARVMFIVLSLQQPNFLILDEPTNHIDIEGREQLESQLMESAASLLLTSHDRRFLETVCNRFVWIRNQKMEEINDTGEFYRSLVESHTEDPLNIPATDRACLGEDALLEEIVALEQKLSEELGRKKKFQKPALQRAFSQRLVELNRLLDQVDR